MSDKSSNEPSAERCIHWNDADVADVSGSQHEDEEDRDTAITFLSSSERRPAHEARLNTPASTATAASSAAHDRTIAYDARDHTHSENPSQIDGPRSLAAATTTCRGPAGGVQEDAAAGKYVLVLPQATPPESCTVSADGAANTTTTNGSNTRHLELVRLPHPRHGNPSLHLVEWWDVETTSGPKRAPRLLEVQAQGPPNDFGQTFFVGEHVLGSDRHGAVSLPCVSSSRPSQQQQQQQQQQSRSGEDVLPLSLSHHVTSSDMLIATPMNPTFLALHVLVERCAITEGTRTLADWQSCAQSQPFLSGDDILSAARTLDPPRNTHARDEVDRRSTAAVESDSPFAFCGGDDASDDAKEEDTMHDMFAGGGDGDDFIRAFQNDRFGAKSGPSRIVAGASAAGSGTTYMHGATTPSSVSPPLPVPLLYGWWPGWAAVRGDSTVLARFIDQVLTSHAALEPLCEIKAVDACGTSTQTNTGDGAYFYRFSPTKAAAWVRAKVESLASSAALASVLQLPIKENGTPQQAAPRDIAVAVVCEYVPERFHVCVMQACGVTGLAAPHETTAPASVVRKRTRAEMEAELEQQQQQQKAAVAPKSASVKRLEKAGRPANTPTLMSMFAKKASPQSEKK